MFLAKLYIDEKRSKLQSFITHTQTIRKAKFPLSASFRAKRFIAQCAGEGALKLLKNLRCQLMLTGA